MFSVVLSVFRKFLQHSGHARRSTAGAGATIASAIPLSAAEDNKKSECGRPCYARLRRIRQFPNPTTARSP